MNWLRELWEKLHQIQHDLNEIRRSQDQASAKLSLVLQKEDKIMALEDDLATALIDLESALTANTTEIEALLTKITTPGVSPTAVQAAVDKIRTLTAAINTEVAKATSQVP